MLRNSRRGPSIEAAVRPVARCQRNSPEVAMQQYEMLEESLAKLGELIAEEHEWDDAEWRGSLSAGCRSVAAAGRPWPA